MTFRSAAELAARPDLMEPPELLVPPFAVAGRSVLVAHPPKGGKSTTGAAVLVEGSRRGVVGGLLTLDEALADSLQRLHRFGGEMDALYLSDRFDPATLEEDVVRLGIRVLVVDHLSKLAQLSPDFQANSQGDPVLWGRLVAPFVRLAREHDVAVVLLDQARRSDGSYSGSTAKAGEVDLLCELREKDGGLACTPRGRIALPPFRVDLDADGCPILSTAGEEGFSRPRRANIVTARHRLDVLAALQSAEPEGLTASAWQSLVAERGGPARSTFFEIRRELHAGGLVSYASKLYRVTPTGARKLLAEEVAA